MPKKIKSLDQLKDWLKVWQLWPVFLAIGGGVFWAARLDASQGTILKRQEAVEDAQKVINEDLRWRYQKDDERWEKLMLQLNTIYEILGRKE